MNISEGRNSTTLEALRQEVEDSQKVFLLDVSSDPDHHRSVYTLAGMGRPVLEASLRVIRRAAQLIDLRYHRGVHPRMGAVDVVPFVPLGAATMAECIELAHLLGHRVAEEFEIPVFFYEEAALHPARKQLAEVRRGGFEQLTLEIGVRPDRYPDCGPPRLHPTAGAVAIGARSILIAFNLFLERENLSAARQIAAVIRERRGGIPGVRALAFDLPSRKQSQISLNVMDYQRVSLKVIFDKTNEEARKLGQRVVSSQIVGLAPRDALSPGLAKKILLENRWEDVILEDRLEEALARDKLQ
ncbi:MAG: glutamate formimidoyltransferase [Acidobacteria bacterium]|nr:glutamate formimidoyltransferase [Acidobacteriota bacterium]